MVDKEFVTDKMDLKWNTQRIYLLKLLLNEIIVKKKNVNIFKMENWWREKEISSVNTLKQANYTVY